MERVVRADELVEVNREAGRNDAEVGAEVEGGGDAEGCVDTVGVLRYCQPGVRSYVRKAVEQNLPTPSASPRSPPPQAPADETSSYSG